MRLNVGSNVVKNIGRGFGFWHFLQRLTDFKCEVQLILAILAYSQVGLNCCLSVGVQFTGKVFFQNRMHVFTNVLFGLSNVVALSYLPIRFPRISRNLFFARNMFDFTVPTG